MIRWAGFALAAIALAGCASRPANVPLAEADRRAGYRYETRADGAANDPTTVIVLAFSGGGMRAAAFSYGVLEELRRTKVTVAGRATRLLDEVDIITGVSGGSFTALAYGLHGEKLFDDYDTRFLKRDVQGMLVARLFAPRNWGAFASGSWGRSEMAAELYDDLLFDGKTYADLMTRPGPMIMATATDLSTGSRLAFTQNEFDLICSDLRAVPLSRAAAASSAVPLVMSPVTLDNYGGRCHYVAPYWIRQFENADNRIRPAGRTLQRLREMKAFQDGASRPFLHLVDGGLADNLGLRVVLESLEELESSIALRGSSRLRRIQRIAVFVVNSLSVPQTDWDRRERPPNDLEILMKATGVPIDRYSLEGVELLRDIVTRWETTPDAPRIELYAIDVSIEAHPDAAERAFLNEAPTSWVLSGEQVDRLRAAPAAILRASDEFARLVRELELPGAKR